MLLIDGYSGIHGEGLTWQARKHVLKDYWKDASFGCNDSMSITFKSVHQNSNLGKLAHVSNDINSIFQLPLSIKQSLTNLLNAINDEILAIKNIDVMWEVEGSDLDYWTTQREIHRLLLVQAWVDYSAILTTHHLNIIAAVPSIQASLNAISPTNVMETNDVYVTNLSLSRLVDPNMTLSAAQLAILENIANQCPLDGGDAVSRARAILHSIDPDYFNAGVNCSGIPGLRSNSNHENINKIQIVPNPNNGNFKFQTDNQTKIHKFTLAIYNVNGTQINTFHSLELNSIVNLDLKAGLYIIKITVEDGTTSCQKLIINK
ncbi:MAG: T9SS type A sorting domain-containing protein [Saprospiraceae bacterium]|nr:T9SS type A sorting domain-containing protein [Candidatus Defluviibacterium haderslevense]